jgi:hypothetical protein
MSLNKSIFVDPLRIGDRAFSPGGRNFRSIGNKSHSNGFLAAALAAAALGFPAASMAAEPGTRALEQQQLQRQQQQEALQLRMRQQDNEVRSPPADLRQRQAAEASEVLQRQRQEAAHYRQTVAPPTAQPSDDPGVRQAKEVMRREAAGRESPEDTRQDGADTVKRK